MTLQVQEKGIFQKILTAIERNSMLLFGEEQAPQYVITSGTYTAPTGSCIYEAQALGEAATISTAKDLDGNTITALNSAVIPVGRTLKGRFSSLKFSAPSANCTIILAQRIIADY